MPTVRINDIDIAYELHGKGRPLVMIMGYSGNRNWWPPELIDALARNHQLLLFDNRGAGESTDDGYATSITLMAMDTIGLMDVLGVRQADILGISMGGLIAQEIVFGYSKRVRRLVLGCTGCGPLWGVKVSLNPLNLWFDYLTREGLWPRKFFVNLFFSQSFLTRQPEKFERFGKRVQQIPTSVETQLKQVAAMLCFDSYFRLKTIQAPSLVMTGTADSMVPPLNSTVLADHIPNARLVTFDGCGHGFVIEAAEAVADEIVGFLNC